MRLRRNIKFDFVIYGCLLGASTLLVFGAKSYCASLSDYNGLSSEIKNAFKEIKGEPIESTPQVEKPSILDNIDEKTIINNYFKSIVDEISTDKNITPSMVKTWNNYEVINTNYIKEITDTYYSYSFDLKIPNKKAQLPTNENKELSTDEYTVISLIANISIKNNENQVKSIDIPK